MLGFHLYTLQITQVNVMASALLTLHQVSTIQTIPKLSKICNDCHSPFHKGSRQNEIESELLSQEPVQDMLKESSRAFEAHCCFSRHFLIFINYSLHFPVLSIFHLSQVIN